MKKTTSAILILGLLLSSPVLATSPQDGTSIHEGTESWWEPIIAPLIALFEATGDGSDSAQSESAPPAPEPNTSEFDPGTGDDETHPIVEPVG